MALVRLQKVLSERGVASRRKAEELIAQGHVKVNGRPAQVGDKVDDRKDIIHVRGKKLGAAPSSVYIALNKPRGYITTLQDEKGRKCVEELVRSVGVPVYPIGRLDKDSEGLLLFTNDGDFANAIMHPSTHVPKLYRVTLRSPMTDEQKLKFEEGIVLDGRRTAPAEVRVVSSEAQRCVVEIVLYEGRNRQIRRMCEALGLEVARLRRNAVGKVKLGMLPIGSWRYLTPEEVRNLVMATGVTKKIAAGYIKNGREPDRDYHNARR
ncbi:MAG: rRNA pseudouridine synthase [Clostridia bacterium]|nr:rRNA pseudouridine synthase [Clostridia bacterium]